MATGYVLVYLLSGFTVVFSQNKSKYFTHIYIYL